ncbi:MAG: hypothetical protein ACD_20C00282G0003 [uncultured bacterium]|nr:MAG: hypothetical protein ACD_20C00282G0003 [uncultured bacterium]
MGRYIGASCRKCRALGEKLFLKAKKCATAKCMLERRNFRPGQHGKNRKKVSEYGIQLTEKQKLKHMYGMGEKQFSLYFQNAARMKGITGNNLLLMLERRLDNVLMRSGFAGSRKQSRQIVRHGHVRINDKRVDIPSYMIKKDDKVQIENTEKAKKMITGIMELTSGRPVPKWLKADAEKSVVEVTGMPGIEDLDHKINVQLIVELYSK